MTQNRIGLHDRISLGKGVIEMQNQDGFYNSSVVIVDPEILAGAPVFKGTRVMAATLFDYLVAGDSLEDFLDDFPTVKREQAVALLEDVRQQYDKAA